MDMVEPLPVTEEGHRFILTACNFGMRFPEQFTLCMATSKDVVEELIELFSRVELPDKILTDRGANFNSGLLQGFNHLLGIHLIRMSAYHPQTDGMV